MNLRIRLLCVLLAGLSTACTILAEGPLTVPANLFFSGYEWEARDTPGKPGPTQFRASNAWVDENGFLNLRLRRSGDAWTGAEVYLKDRLGFGRYQFEVVGALDRLDPNVVLGLFSYTRPDIGPDGTNEIDIEFSRWGRPTGKNGHYTIWPSRVGQRKQYSDFDFKLETPDSTHRFIWRKDAVTLQSRQGHQGHLGNAIFDWTAPSDSDTFTPPQRPMPVHINLWTFEGRPPSDGQEVVVVIKSFSFVPLE